MASRYKFSEEEIKAIEEARRDNKDKRAEARLTVAGEGRARTNAYIAGGVEDVGADIFQRGLCLPSDNKMTEEQQERIIEVVRRCFE